jgi:hypothetical protein
MKYCEIISEVFYIMLNVFKRCGEVWYTLNIVIEIVLKKCMKYCEIILEVFYIMLNVFKRCGKYGTIRIMLLKLCLKSA